MKITKLQLKEIVQEAFNQLLLEKKFNPKFLDQMNFPTDRDRMLYLQDALKLKFLGAGSSRAVYLLDSKRVIKTATHMKGYAQNEAELSIASNPSSAPVVARIFEHGDEPVKWLVSELVRPLKSSIEFEELTGIKWQFFIDALPIMNNKGFDNWLASIRRDIQDSTPERPSMSSRYYAKTVKELDGCVAAPFFQGMIRALRSQKDQLDPGDLVKVGHWGKTPDQRVVLLDYGFTESVANQWY